MSRWERFEYTAILRSDIVSSGARVKDRVLGRYANQLKLYHLDFMRHQAQPPVFGASIEELERSTVIPWISHQRPHYHEALDWDVSQDLVIHANDDDGCMQVICPDS